MTAEIEIVERVLIVDDDEDVRAALQRTIKRIGYEAHVAADGVEGLAQAAKLDPSVIILDLRMPNMDGHTFLRRLATLQLDSVVVVASGNGEMDDVIDVMRHGAVDYLRKPWAPSEILAALTRAAEIREKRRTWRALQSGELSRTVKAEPPVEKMEAPAVVPEPKAEVSTAPSPRQTQAPAPPIFAQILERIRGGEIVLPSVPAVISELRDAVANGDTSTDIVAALVAQDQALTARVLQLGRSALYAGGKSKNDVDLQSTISRVGFERLHSLIETIWVNGCFQIRDPRFTPFTQRLARFGLARAISMRTLAPHAKIVGASAYFAGLFADVGATFLLYLTVEKSTEKISDPEACVASVRSNHEEIGAQLLAKWGNSEDVVKLARHHHFDETQVPSSQYGKLFVLGGALAAELTGDEDLTSDKVTADFVKHCASALGIEPVLRLRCTNAASLELASVLEAL